MTAAFRWIAIGSISFGIYAGCSGGDESLIRPCDDELVGQCGVPCETSLDCPSGLYCEDAQCTADCTPGGGQCPDGQSCGPRGRCEDTLDIGGGADGSTNGRNGSFGDACTDIDVPFDEVTPSVMLLVDQSGSMDDPFGNSTRWDVLHDALMNQNDGVVWTLQDKVRFGLALYTSHNGNEGGMCPILQEVPLALNNHGAIENVYGSESPDGDTPTAESIEAVTATLEAFGEPGPKYIVLVTDGLPDNCEDADAHNAQSQRMSVDAAQAAHDAGVVLIPMGLSEDIATQGAGPGHLQDLANAGAGLPLNTQQDARFYVASDDPSELSAQFQSIIGGLRTCTFDLNGTVDPTLAHLGVITLDGERLELDDPNGWELTNPRQIEIVGDACDRIQSSASRLSITFPCGSDAIDIDIR